MSSHVSKQPPEPTLFFGVEERDRRRRVFAGVGSRHPEDAWLRGAGDEMGGGGRWRRREGKGMDEEYIPGSQPVLPFFQPPRWSLRTLMGSNHPPDAAHERLPHHERRAMACTGDGGTIDTDCDEEDSSGLISKIRRLCALLPRHVGPSVVVTSSSVFVRVLDM
ncbi:hypothetical protein PtA15_5A602 [Puccinia triticina]|uniref:Uncharacterized protein n=1 Tax=Puccinia triticina TaxID=208348 RepID=A0ABY7CII5_9BASI|nr:uncharacterized protein PtA15_5A602 [Puccinia triticina]WAQ85028.1 hypothetical protein PtA15_5A602 [Puccinia triticina]